MESRVSAEVSFSVEAGLNMNNKNDKKQRLPTPVPESGPANPGRRRALRLLVAGLAGAALTGRTPGLANNRGSAAWERIEPARERLNGATPKDGAIKLDLPGVTQDGSAVPLTVEIDSPMSEDDFIEAVYLYAGGNPTPELLDVYLTPLVGRARFSTRIRLNKSQSVLALARTNRGEWLAGDREVRVTVSGCLSRDDTYDFDAVMRTRVRVPERLEPGQIGEVRTLIDHPMETGLREDGEGQPIPERIINEFRAEFNGKSVLKARLYRAISANPYLRFPIAPNGSGEATFHWTEDTGESVSESFRMETG